MKQFCFIFVVWIGVMSSSVLYGTSLQIKPVCVGDTLKIEIIDPDSTVMYQLTGPLSLFYNFSDSIYTYAIPNANISHNGTYYVFYTDSSGNIQTFSAVAAVSNKPIVSVTSSPICVGSQVVMTATDASTGGMLTTFVWNINSSIFTGNEITFVPLGGFTCYLTAISQGGCSFDTVFTISIAPENYFTFSSPMCSGDPLTITPFQEGTFLWHPTGETTPTIIPKVDVATIYSLDFTSKTGCTFTVEGIVYPKPEAVFSMRGITESGYKDVVNKETVIMYNDEAIIDFFDQTESSTRWYWDFGDGYSQNNFSYKQDPSHIYTDPGKYSIRLYAYNNFDCQDVTSQDLYIELPFLFYIPNAFSPNDDGVNDLFCVSGEGFSKENFAMNIYDRHNRLLYHTDNPDDCWSGLASNGKSYPIDVYYLNIQLMTLEGEIKEYHSTVTLVR
ncbi:MAG: gliding motility-associated C-terminal domain-containing protein [Bacteroidales bacterium]|jgi:gliding motility-associated-like protein|nr:gliding motility-associated C-terminal domain-containing protein [Bacteroidales bacterium]